MVPVPRTLSRLLLLGPLLFPAPLHADTPPALPDPAAFEPSENLPGGKTTHRRKRNRNAFSLPSANLGFEEQLDFRLGNALFKRIWVSSPASTKAADGLGPLFNARSCQRCHLKDGRGHPPNGNFPDDTAVSMFLRLSIPPQNQEQEKLLASGKANVIPDPIYGGQLQDFSIQGIPAEGRMYIDYDEKQLALADGETVTLLVPRYQVTDLNYGDFHPDVTLSPRVAPPMIGLGLLELVPEADILSRADPDDSDGDGISGRGNRVWNRATQQVELGRFGWKSGHPTLDQQNQGAFSGDIGLSTPLFPDNAGECSDAQILCRAAPHGGDAKYQGFEVPTQMTDLVLFYTRNLAPPHRPKAKAPEVLRGKAEFHAAGCAACHTPRMVTGVAADRPNLSGQVIWPYSDLLLHDMGEGLADNRPEGRASGREWRTPPLWGIGATRTVSGHTRFLHDGRARNLLEAILWHGGEARRAKEHVMALPKARRDDLIRFLESL